MTTTQAYNRFRMRRVCWATRKRTAAQRFAIPADTRGFKEYCEANYAAAKFLQQFNFGETYGA